MKLNKRSILGLLHMPPPLHGVSYLNKLIVEHFCNPDIELMPLEIRYGSSITSVGKFSWRKIFIYLKLICSFSLIVCTKKVDAFYFSITPTGKGFFRDSIFVLIAKLFRIKTVLHIHGIGIDREINSKFKLAYYRFVFRNTNIISLSKSIQWDLFKIKDVINKNYIINNGIVIQSFEAKKENTKDYYTICSLSTITPLKGQMTLLKAIDVLVNQEGIRNIKCIILGQISNHEYYRKLRQFVADNRLEKYVEFAGEVWDGVKNEYLLQSDIFVFTTEWESFGLVVLEAFNFKLPVIASDVGSISEIVDHSVNGFVVKPKDHINVAKYIDLLIKDDNMRREMGNRGYDKLVQKYSLDTFIQNINSMYKDLLEVK